MRNSLFDNKDLLEYACKNFSSVAQAMGYLGRAKIGGNYKTFYKYCDKYGLTPPRVDLKENTKIAVSTIKRTNEAVFVKECPFKVHGQDLRERLVDLGVEDKCTECGQLPIWNSKPLVLQVDHINGINNDNRIDNLRILCGHCHSQTETFCGRNRKKLNNCSICFKAVKAKSKMCITCRNKTIRPQEKISWPPDEDLRNIVWQKPMVEISKDLGISDRAIKKRCNVRQIDTPPRGYWSKLL